VCQPEEGKRAGHRRVPLAGVKEHPAAEPSHHYYWATPLRQLAQL
jgi:hypothetical protein